MDKYLEEGHDHDELEQITADAGLHPRLLRRQGMIESHEARPGIRQQDQRTRRLSRVPGEG